MFGTMSIPDPLDAAAAREALDYFFAAGFDKIDTAIIYQGGTTETTLGINVPTGKHANRGTCEIYRFCREFGRGAVVCFCSPFCIVLWC